MFVGRKYELAELEKYWKEGAFQFAVFYGRRRVGKTTLINKFKENKKSILINILFSKSNFTSGLVKTADRRGDTVLVNLAQLFL